MKWIGLTGGIATGKSTVAQILRKSSWPVIDADELAHQAFSPEYETYEQVVKLFGKDILDHQNEIDRSKLGPIVFANSNKLKQLEDIVHPQVQKMVLQYKRDLENQGFDLAVYDVPLLYEKNLQERFDAVIVVATTPEIQKLRMIERNKWSEEEIENRLNTQWPIDKKVALADYVIENNGSLAALKQRVQVIVRQLSETV